jgi:hypothetical protein
MVSAEVYDPATDTWSTTGSLATARSNHPATLLPSGKVLVAGGYNNTGSLSSAELYESVVANSTAVTASSNPASLNLPVTLTATVTPTPSGGTVSFTDNASPIPSCQAVPLVGASATCTVSSPDFGV